MAIVDVEGGVEKVPGDIVEKYYMSYMECVLILK